MKLKKDRDARKLRKQVERALPEQTDLLGFAAEALRRGALQEAEEACRRILARAPNHAEALNIMGMIALGLRRTSAAVDALEKAAAQAPHSAFVRNNLAFAYRLADRLEDAVAQATEAARIDPEMAAAHTMLGTALNDLGRPAEAYPALLRALELSPGLSRVMVALGVALQALGRGEEARHRYEEAIAAGGIEAWSHLGRLNAENRHYIEAARCFREGLAARRASKWWPGGEAAALPRQTTPANVLKLDHDIEQFAHLMAQGDLGSEFAATIAAYRQVKQHLTQAHGPGANVLLSPREIAPIADTFARVVHWRETPAQEGTVLGTWDRAAIEAAYAVDPGICWIDGLLTAPALDALRRFCLDSTIWNDLWHNQRGETARGYLGTYIDDGFCCPLLFQIAEQLTQALPGVFKHHRLRQMWAYKYEAALEGIALHGDDAAVNVNFWLTPDDANLDPDSGGLIVHPVEAPADWSFADINKHPDRIRAFLDQAGTKPVNVPYRQNRAVIFNSDLFHATAPLRFRPGYENRRINVTMLFGRRDGG
jgi:Flp pilus assembly protein TadD